VPVRSRAQRANRDPRVRKGDGSFVTAAPAREGADRRPGRDVVARPHRTAPGDRTSSAGSVAGWTVGLRARGCAESGAGRARDDRGSPQGRRTTVAGSHRRNGTSPLGVSTGRNPFRTSARERLLAARPRACVEDAPDEHPNGRSRSAGARGGNRPAPPFGPPGGSGARRRPSSNEALAYLRRERLRPSRRHRHRRGCR